MRILLAAGAGLLVAGAGVSLTGQAAAGTGPSATDARATCGDNAAVLFGRLHDAATDIPLPGGTVQLTWREARGLADTTVHERETRADGRGHFTFCGAPTAVHLTLGARVLGRAGHPQALQLGEGAVVRQDVEVRFGQTTGGLAGTLEDVSTGDPIGSATLTIPELGVSALSDGQGRFRLEDLPVGDYEAEVRHVGYGTRSVPVDVYQGQTAHVRIELPQRAIEVEPLVVTIDVRPRWLENRGFYHRRSRGLGAFVGPEELEKQDPQRLNEVLRRMEGLHLRQVCTPYCYYVISTAGRTRFDFCPPQFFVDGKKVFLRALADLESLANANDLAAVEAYRGIAQTPAEFYDQCGSVVIWTKRTNS